MSAEASLPFSTARSAGNADCTTSMRGSTVGAISAGRRAVREASAMKCCRRVNTAPK